MAKCLIEEHDLQQAIRVLEALLDRVSSPQQKEKINKLLLVANQALRESPLGQPLSPVATAKPVSREEKRVPDGTGLEVTESGSDRDPSDQDARIPEADQALGTVLSVLKEPSPAAAVERCKVRLYWEVEPKRNPAGDPDQGGFDVRLILGFSHGHIIRVRYLRIQKAWSRWPAVLDDPELELGGNEGTPSIKGESGLVVCPLEFPHDFSPSFRSNWLTRHLFCPRLGWRAEVWIEVDCETSRLELEAWCFRRRVWRWTREVPGYQCFPSAVFPPEAQSS